MILRSGGQAIIEVNKGKAERLERSFPHNGLRKLFAASKWGLFMLCGTVSLIKTLERFFIYIKTF